MLLDIGDELAAVLCEHKKQLNDDDMSKVGGLLVAEAASWPIWAVISAVSTEYCCS